MAVPLVVLVVLDGWGLAPPSKANAIYLARTPNIDRYWAAFPHTKLQAAGESVGLPKGEPGNTETGHLNLGAGRIVYQDLPRINIGIANGSFFKNKVFLQALEHAKKRNSNLHLMGLVSSGTVHASINHLYALLRLAKEQNFSRVFVHVFTDGRDSSPNSAITSITELMKFMSSEGLGQIATVMGRYWAMDRDQRWERTQKAYFALTDGQGRHSHSVFPAIEESYEMGITDEFIEPIILEDARGEPLARIKEGDSVIFFNFRIDRPRQLTKAFVWDDFEQSAHKEWGFDPYQVRYEKKHAKKPKQVKPFSRGPKIKDLYFVTMTEYGKPLGDKTHVAFPPVEVKYPLGTVVAQTGYRQLRLAESEKERFVTFYFNGQSEIRNPGEEWIIANSPVVSTYDLKPEMSAPEIVQAFLGKIGTTLPPPYKLTLINFANPDMLAHTGNKEALVRGLEVIDTMLYKIVQRVDLLGGVTLITGDHGNAEQIMSPTTGEIDTEHTQNPVPFIAVGRSLLGRGNMLQSGILADVAPTVLELLGIKPPSIMTGRSLLKL